MNSYFKKVACSMAVFALAACNSSASNKQKNIKAKTDEPIKIARLENKITGSKNAAHQYTDEVKERVVLDYGNRAIRTDKDLTISFPRLVKDKKNCFIVISKKDYYLYVYEKQGDNTVLIARYDCALGLKKGNKEKRGDMRTPHSPKDKPFKISQIVDASTWKHDFGDGRGNIKAYGDYFLRLVTPGHSGIGIHGSTNNRESVPGRASEGCIRLKDEDIIDLRKNYAFVGMKVIIKAEDEGDLPFETQAMKKQNIQRKRNFNPVNTFTNEQVQTLPAERGRS